MAMKLDGIKRLVAYRRVSTGEQASEGFSLEGQMSDIEYWAAQNNIEIVKWYTDEGVSGHGLKRAEFDIMISDLCNETLLADGAVFYTTSRMGRRLSVTAKALDDLRSCGKVVISISENLISNDPSSRFVFNMLGCANELQSAQTSEDVKKRLTDTANNGFYPGGGVDFGYKTIEVRDQNNKVRKKMVIQEEEKEIVTKIFNLSYKGHNGKPLGLLSIASKLNKEGFLNRQKRWDRNKINKILRSTTYIGKYKYRKNRPDEIIIEVPRIVTDDIFEAVGNGLTDRQLKNTESKGPRSTTLLTGIVKCAFCGLNLTLCTGKSGRYHYYRCITNKNRGAGSCPCPIIPKEKMDNAIKNILLSHIYTEEHILETYSELNKICKSLVQNDRTDLKKKKQKCNKIKERLANLYEQVGDGIIELDSSLKEYLQQQRSQLTSLEKELIYINKRINLKILKFGINKTKIFCESINKFFKQADDETLKALLLAMVKEIRVYSDKLVLKGSKFQLVNIASKAKAGTPLEVPAFVSIWR